MYLLNNLKESKVPFWAGRLCAQHMLAWAAAAAAWTPATGPFWSARQYDEARGLTPGGISTRVHLIFVLGLPRSGTTLVTEFILNHPEVVGLLLNSTGLTDSSGESTTDEYAPYGAEPYRGSRECLQRMCGPESDAYVNRAAEDIHRWDCNAYASKAISQAGDLNDFSGQETLTFLAKHPAMFVGSSYLAKSCAAIGVKASFVAVYRSPYQWEADSQIVPGKNKCAGPCRDAIVRNTARCYHAAEQTWVPGTVSVRFEDFDQLSTWRAIEQALQLKQVLFRLWVPCRPRRPPCLPHSPVPTRVAGGRVDLARKAEGNVRECLCHLHKSNANRPS